MEKETVVYMYAMQYYFASTKEILQFMTCVNLEDIRVSEISQAQEKKNKTCMTSRNLKSQIHRSRELPRAGRWENWGDVGQRVQSCSYVG